jgi:hypothetical protein
VTADGERSPPRVTDALIAFHHANARRLRLATYRNALMWLWTLIARRTSAEQR